MNLESFRAQMDKAVDTGHLAFEALKDSLEAHRLRLDVLRKGWLSREIAGKLSILESYANNIFFGTNAKNVKASGSYNAQIFIARNNNGYDWTHNRPEPSSGTSTLSVIMQDNTFTARLTTFSPEGKLLIAADYNPAGDITEQKMIRNALDLLLEDAGPHMGWQEDTFTGLE